MKVVDGLPIVFRRHGFAFLALRWSVRRYLCNCNTSSENCQTFQRNSLPLRLAVAPSGAFPAQVIPTRSIQPNASTIISLGSPYQVERGSMFVSVDRVTRLLKTVILRAHDKLLPISNHR